MHFVSFRSDGNREQLANFHSSLRTMLTPIRPVKELSKSFEYQM